MSFLAAMQDPQAAAAGPKMGPPAATPGLGAPPSLPGLPPPPTNIGALPLGTPGTTAKTAGDDAITALRVFQGFKPSMQAEIESMISKIKDTVKGEPIPPTGEAQAPGTPASPTPVSESGSTGDY